MRRLIPALVAVMLFPLVTGCGPSGSGPTGDGNSVATATPDPNTLGASGDTDGVVSPGPGEPWDVLFLADRQAPMSDTVVELYRQAAEDVLGVPVRLQNTSQMWPPVRDVLGYVRDERYPPMSDLVRESEIIVVQVWPVGTVDSEFIENCELLVSNPTAPDPAVFGAAEYLSDFRAALDELYAEIWALREGAPTVLITSDYYDPYVAGERELGMDAECRALYESFWEIGSEVAGLHRVRLVSLYDLMNGPEHDLDPQGLGYIGPTEEMPAIPVYVPNEVGSLMIADALAEIGFEPVTAP